MQKKDRKLPLWARERQEGRQKYVALGPEAAGAIQKKRYAHDLNREKPREKDAVAE